MDRVKYDVDRHQAEHLLNVVNVFLILSEYACDKILVHFHNYHDECHDYDCVDDVRDCVYLGHGCVSSADLPSYSGSRSELDTQRDHVQKTDDINYRNLGGKLVLSKDSSEDSKQFESPPLGTLHHSARYTELKELFGPLPVERVPLEERLHVVLKEAPPKDMNVELLRQIVGAVGDIERQSRSCYAHIQMHDD